MSRRLEPRFPPARQPNCMGRNEDVFIVGGGPAGLAAAIALRQKGLAVTVADGAAMPVDKVCGEGILPEGVSILTELGVEIPTRDSVPLKGIRFWAGSQCAEAEFPGARGLGVRRLVLHRAMIEAARAAGVTLHWRSPVELGPNSALSCGGRMRRPAWIVGADGAFSRTRRWACLQSGEIRRKRFAFRRHYQISPWSDFVEVYWGKRCQFYATPLSGSEVGVVLLSRNSHVRIEQALEGFPVLAARLRGARSATRGRGGITGDWRQSRVVRQNIALVGDAAGLVDAISGDGLRLAFCQAVALAEALASQNPARYQVRHRRLMRRPGHMAQVLLAMQNSPFLQRQVIGLLARQPALFRRLLSLHTGASPDARLAARDAKFGESLLAGSPDLVGVLDRVSSGRDRNLERIPYDSLSTRRAS